MLCLVFHEFSFTHCKTFITLKNALDWPTIYRIKLGKEPSPEQVPVLLMYKVQFAIV